jgi:large subunit ribosomal protein L31
MVPGFLIWWRYSFCKLKESGIMKADIHPNYDIINVTCSCGHNFETRSTLAGPLAIEVCAECHPFYTGKQKLVDTGGRVQKFRDRYSKRTEN